MTDKIQFQFGTSGANVYAVIRNMAAQVYRADTGVFEAYQTANLTATKYAITLVEQGSATAYYVVDFPTAISAGEYAIVICQRAGGAPAESDTKLGVGEVQWDGYRSWSIGSKW